MKIKLQLSIVSFLVSVYSFGQHAIAGQDKFNASMNNYQTVFLTDNDMFWNYITNDYKTFIPKNSGISPIFAGSCWMGGYDQNNTLHTAAMTYRQTGIDFWPGPMDTTTLLADSLLCHSFDSFFPIYKTQVDSQRNHLYTASTIPQQILNCPGNGIPTYHTSYKLAPYQDVNHNNTYDPLNGDYPIILGDYSIYQLGNDVGNIHGETHGVPFGFETHTTQYIIDCPADSALWNTMFTHYEIINRSANTYHNFYFTMWLDFDLGYYMDDYIGCDTASNMFYVYNGDNYDDDLMHTPNPSTPGYHDHLPAFCGYVLNKKLSVFTAYDNTASSYNGNPNNAGAGIEYYNLMSGLWENAQPMRNDGIRGLSTTGSPTKFLFSGDPYTNTGWTEANAGNVPNDRRGQGSCGPYTINPHDTLKIDFAYIFARDYQNTGNNVACFPILKQYAQNIQNYYNSNTTPCGSTFTAGIKQQQASIKNNITVYPNPSSGMINISSQNNLDEIRVTNLLGQLIYQAKPQQPNSSFQLNEAGVYFISTTVGKETSTQKLLCSLSKI